MKKIILTLAAGLLIASCKKEAIQPTNLTIIELKCSDCITLVSYTDVYGNEFLNKSTNRIDDVDFDKEFTIESVSDTDTRFQLYANTTLLKDTITNTFFYSK